MYLSCQEIEVFIAAIDGELLRLKTLAEQSTDDSWPDDYDPNDAVIFASMRELLEKHRETGLELASPQSKPVRMVLELLK